MDLSLDDFIIQKGIKSNNVRRQRKGRFKKSENNTNNNNKLRTGIIRKRPAPIQDARNKIIQNSRRKIGDAREKLVELAKQGDAREKLNKLKQRQIKTSGPRIKKMGRAYRPASSLILRTIDPSVSNPDIKTFNDEDDIDLDDVSDIGSLTRTVHNRLAVSDVLTTKANPVIDLVNDVDMFERSAAVTNRLTSPSMPMTRLKIVTHNHQSSQLRSSGNGGWGSVNSQLGMGQVGTMRSHLLDDPELSLARNPRLSQEMKSRLDMPVSPASRSMGILAGSGAAIPAVQPQGYRIVVSNLHSKVTHEDIKELFGDIGQLVASHVVRPGTAEVIYQNLRDANKAVDAYHNRTLDGQPMKCMLVNTRPPHNSAASARPGAKYPNSTKSAVRPDIGAIHKALFSK